MENERRNASKAGGCRVGAGSAIDARIAVSCGGVSDGASGAGCNTGTVADEVSGGGAGKANSRVGG